ncbi:MAG: LrgB family protein [Paludibacteraceae bacterium]|nr:LrgB family protein [Paludibacteraceae bacterium]
MKELILNVPAMLTLTVGTYLLGVFCKNKSGISLLHPFIICIPIIIALLKVMDISADEYMEHNQIITFLQGPSVVALGLSIYDNLATIKKNMAAILSAVIVGSIVGVVSVYVLCGILNLDPIFDRSLESKSLTTPIAMDLTAALGGNISLTAISVVLCGFIGAVFGPLMWKIFRIDNPIAKGLAMGCSSHGLGTTRAIEVGALEGAVSGLSIALMCVATALVIPIFNSLIGQ